MLKFHAILVLLVIPKNLIKNALLHELRLLPKKFTSVVIDQNKVTSDIRNFGEK